MTDSIEDLAKQLGVPVIGPLPPNPAPYNPNPVIGICGECGRQVHQIEGYSCSRNRCPVQPRVF